VRNHVREEATTTTHHTLYGLNRSGSIEDTGTSSGPLTAGAGTTLFYCDNANRTSVAPRDDAPFGNGTCATAPASPGNAFRSSIEYPDTDADLYYYGLRYYNPEMGRWVNRDPIGASVFVSRHSESIGVMAGG
jgi:RHS repeat-associated protein